MQKKQSKTLVFSKKKKRQGKSDVPDFFRTGQNPQKTKFRTFSVPVKIKKATFRAPSVQVKIQRVGACTFSVPVKIQRQRSRPLPYRSKSPKDQVQDFFRTGENKKNNVPGSFRTGQNPKSRSMHFFRTGQNPKTRFWTFSVQVKIKNKVQVFPRTAVLSRTSSFYNSRVKTLFQGAAGHNQSSAIFALQNKLFVAV